ncbi:MAG TPA: MFS transporter [Marinobacterium sp.]|nr:MFS transporter [Marinobacterium sp.]
MHLPSLFANRQFSQYWIGQMSGAMAQQMLMVGLGWQVYMLTNSALALGLVGLARYLPQLLLTVHAGHMADRHSRVKQMLFSRALMGAAILTLAITSLTGAISANIIYLCCIAMGISQTYGMPAGAAVIPNLVSKQDLAQAMTLTAAGREFCTIAGPALGGFIYILGASTLYLSSFTLTLISLAVIFLMPPIPQIRDTGKRNLKELLAGFTFVWRTKPILGAVSIDMLAVLIGSVTALLPIVAHDILETNSAGLGILRSAPAAGALLMSLYLARHPIKRQSGRKLYSAVAVFGLGTIGFGLSESFALSLAMLFTLGAADMVSVVVRSTLVQIETPDAMRGRVSSVNSLFIATSNQMGEFESGVLATFVGAVPAILFGGVGTLLITALWIPLFPTLWNRDALVPEEDTK